MILLIKEEAQAVIKINRHLFEQKDCSPRDADSGSNPIFAQDRTKKGKIYVGKNHKM